MDNFLVHILVVDDDEGIVKQYLNENKYLVTTADSAEDAKKVDVIKFDFNSRYNDAWENGLEFIEEQNKLDTPIILLAKGQINRVEGLEIGADDYLPNL